MVQVLESDHDLGELFVGSDFGLERIGRAEGERRRDESVDFSGTDGVVHEWVCNDIMQTVIEHVGRGQWRSRSARIPDVLCAASAAGAATATAATTGAVRAAGAQCGAGRIGDENVDRNNGRLRDELGDDTGHWGSVTVDCIGQDGIDRRRQPRQPAGRPSPPAAVDRGVGSGVHIAKAAGEDVRTRRDPASERRRRGVDAGVDHRHGTPFSVVGYTECPQVIQTDQRSARRVGQVGRRLELPDARRRRRRTWSSHPPRS